MREICTSGSVGARGNPGYPTIARSVRLVVHEARCSHHRSVPRSVASLQGHPPGARSRRVLAWRGGVRSSRWNRPRGGSLPSRHLGDRRQRTSSRARRCTRLRLYACGCTRLRHAPAARGCCGTLQLRLASAAARDGCIRGAAIRFLARAHADVLRAVSGPEELEGDESRGSWVGASTWDQAGEPQAGGGAGVRPGARAVVARSTRGSASSSVTLRRSRGPRNSNAR